MNLKMSDFSIFRETIRVLRPRTVRERVLNREDKGLEVKSDRITKEYIQKRSMMMRLFWL